MNNAPIKNTTPLVVQKGDTVKDTVENIFYSIRNIRTNDSRGTVLEVDSEISALLHASSTGPDRRSFVGGVEYNHSSRIADVVIVRPDFPFMSGILHHNEKQTSIFIVGYEGQW